VKTQDWRKTRAEQYDNELVSHRTQPDIYIWYFLLATNGGEERFIRAGQQASPQQLLLFLQL